MSETTDTTTTKTRWLTTAQAAEEVGVRAERMLGFVKRGEIPAVNVADRLNTRPCFRIRRSDLEAWLLRRQVIPRPSVRRRRPRPRTAKRYFPE